MKTLITKADGTPTKSKVHALQFLDKKGISKDCLIEENGQFFYDSPDVFAEIVERPKAAEIFKETAPIIDKNVSWDTPVFGKNDVRTQLYIPNTGIVATINAKYPAGQNRSKSCFGICIGDENFVMSVDLVSKLFKVRG